MLHRLILAQNSGFFEASTSGEWSRAQVQGQEQGEESGNGRALTAIGEEEEGSQSGSTRAGSQMPPGQKTKWRYELDTGSGDHEDEVPMLVQKVRLILSLSTG